MKYIVYVSTAHKLMTDDELLELLQAARAKNQQHGLTGMLLYCQGMFMQALEGDSETVDLIYKAIELDKRHKNIIQLASGNLNTRNFPDWTMAFASVSSETMHEIEGFLSFPDLNLPGNADHPIISMLKNFIDTNKDHLSF